MPAASGSVRVLLVDDDPGFLASLRALLEHESQIEIVGSAESGDRALELAILLRPDLITMDLEMPGMDGVEATKRIKELLPATPIVVVSASGYAERAALAREAGASAYVPKSRVADELAATILAVAGGENFVLVR
jgi:DNA-binding NarL/FixJ family response regulator